MNTPRTETHTPVLLAEDIDLGVRSVSRLRVRSAVRAGTRSGSAKNANNGEGWNYSDRG